MRRLLALLVLIAGCDGPGVVGPGTARLGRAGTSSAATALHGSWRRVVFFLDEFNIARSTETTYQFAADGTLVRVQVATNHTFGLSDVLVSAGRWRLDGAQVRLDFVTPSAFQLVLGARVVGDELELGGQRYLRVGS